MSLLTVMFNSLFNTSEPLNVGLIDGSGDKIKMTDVVGSTMSTGTPASIAAADLQAAITALQNEDLVIKSALGHRMVVEMIRAWAPDGTYPAQLRKLGGLRALKGGGVQRLKRTA